MFKNKRLKVELNRNALHFIIYISNSCFILFYCLLYPAYGQIKAIIHCKKSTHVQ